MMPPPAASSAEVLYEGFISLITIIAYVFIQRKVMWGTVAGQARRIVLRNTVEEDNGFEAWRRLNFLITGLQQLVPTSFLGTGFLGKKYSNFEEYRRQVEDFLADWQATGVTMVIPACRA